MIEAGRRGRLRDTPGMKSRPTIDGHPLESVRRRVDGVLARLPRAVPRGRRRSRPGRRDPRPRDRAARARRRQAPAPGVLHLGLRGGARSAGPAPEPGAGEPIVRAAAALELLHTMALIHDDLMDGTARRRGVAASAPHLVASGAGRPGARSIRRASARPPRCSPAISPPCWPTGSSSRAVSRPTRSPARSRRTTRCASTWRPVSWPAWAAPVEAGEALRVARLKGGATRSRGRLIVGAGARGRPCRGPRRAAGVRPSRSARPSSSATTCGTRSRRPAPPPRR